MVHREPSMEAFTLVELLVVLAVIGAVMTAALVHWPRSDHGRAVRSGEAIVRGALGAARGRAALANADVLLVVDVSEPGSETYLRFLRLYCVEPAPQGTWFNVPAHLPSAVRVVPPRVLQLPGVEFAPDWPAALGSTALLSPDPAVPPGYLRLARFTPAGLMSGDPGGWTLGVAERRGSAWRFQDAAVARAVIVSRYGVPTAAAGLAE